MIALYITLGVLGALLVFFLLPTLFVSSVIYAIILVRTKKSKWNRENSQPDDPQQVAICADADRWSESHAACRREVTVRSDGCRLVGEYYDLGYTRAVIIIPGRTEACRYGCHFAWPYERAGFNVLTIDNRCHGKSEGRFNTLGYREHHDILAWARLLHDTLGNETVVLHGVCIGSSTALFACVSPDCPDYLTAMTADGMYATFYDSFRLHLIEQKRPLHPFLGQIMCLIRLFSHADVVHDGPVYRMPRMKKRILFLHGRHDQYSVAENAQKLFDICPAEKRLVWFDKGLHSRIRLHNPEPYDAAVEAFYRDAGCPAGESVTENPII